MSKQVKRSYRSDRREEQARETRSRIRASATELFVECGFSATSIAAVAEAAGVAPQTVYANFGSKAQLLAEAIDVALAGDDQPVALAERLPDLSELAATSSEDVAVMIARMSSAVLKRAGSLIQVADAAAQSDASLIAMWKAGHRGRLKDMKVLIARLEDSGHLRDEIEVDGASELLWVLTSPDTYRSFTVLLGWSAKKYERWLGTTIQQALFTGVDVQSIDIHEMMQ
ncbi:MAG TPA: TetR/AcrR family transcriptional regulator [Microthrixaceae bacterium]|nr:TetR/AcrR family transcriptional regulator [Microthrixaceae bacterium]